MRTRLGTIALAAMLLFGIAAGAAACGGDGGPSPALEEFFQRLEEIDGDFEARAAELEPQFNALDETSTVDDAVDLFRQQTGLIDEFVERLADLDAPDEASDLLNEAVSAGRDVVVAFNGFVEEGESAGSVEAFFTAFDEPALDETLARFDEACLDLEQLAADNDITVDFSCE